MTTALSVSEQTSAIQTALDERDAMLLDLLPSRRHVDRFKRIVVLSLARNPDLLTANRGSLIEAAFEAARLGLEPSGAIGGAHIVRYGQKAQLIVDYRGLVDLARRSSEIQDIAAVIVRRGDGFHVRRGTSPAIEHTPLVEVSEEAEKGGALEVTHVYAVAHLFGGGVQFEVMTKAQIDAIRARSAAANHGPWRTDYEEMAKKTVLRRLCKLLPLSIEVREILERESEAEFVPVREEPVSPSLRDRIAERASVLADDLPDIPSGPVEYDQPPVEIDEVPA